MDDGNEIVTCLMNKKKHIRLLLRKEHCSFYSVCFQEAWTYREQKIHCTNFAILCIKHHSHNKNLIVFKSKLVTSLFTVHVVSKISICRWGKRVKVSGTVYDWIYIKKIAHCFMHCSSYVFYYLISRQNTELVQKVNGNRRILMLRKMRIGWYQGDEK